MLQNHLLQKPPILARAFSIGIPLILLFFQQMRFYPFFMDDSYISLVYVRNFLEGNGLTYNGRVVEGYSNFLWVIAVSLLSSTGLDIILSAKWLGMFCSYGTVLVLVRFGQRYLGNWYAGILASLLLAAAGPFIIWSVGGLETALFTLLLVLMVYTLYCESQNSAHAFPWSALIAVLLALTRPEGIGLAGIAWGWLCINYLFFQPKPRRSYLIQWTAIVGIGFGAFLLWRIWYYHDILPATVYAKRRELPVQIHLGIDRLTPLLREWCFIAGGAFIGVIGLLVDIKTRHRSLGILLLGLLGGYSAFIVMAGSDWMPMHRFVAPLLPLVMFVVIKGILSLATLCTRSATYRWIVVVFLSLIPFVQLHLWTEHRRTSTLDYAQNTLKGSTAFGKYIRKIADPDQTKLAIIDAGAIAYYANVPMLDMFGLNDKHIAHLPGTFGKRCDTDYVLRFQPSWIESHYLLSEGGNPIFINFGCMHELYYTKEFQRWYTIDNTAPMLPFKRRDQPLRQTMLDNFYAAAMELETPLPELQINSQEQVMLSLSNQGSGVWISYPEIHQGVVYLVVRLTSRETNACVKEQWIPLPKDVFPNDHLTIPIDIQSPATPGKYELCIDLALKDITLFSEQGAGVIQQPVTVTN